MKIVSMIAFTFMFSLISQACYAVALERFSYQATPFGMEVSWVFKDPLIQNSPRLQGKNRTLQCQIEKNAESLELKFSYLYDSVGDEILISDINELIEETRSRLSNVVKGFWKTASPDLNCVHTVLIVSSTLLELDLSSLEPRTRDIKILELLNILMVPEEERPVFLQTLNRDRPSEKAPSRS